MSTTRASLPLAEGDHFNIVSDEKSLPLVTFNLKEKKGRTYTECEHIRSAVCSPTLHLLLNGLFEALTQMGMSQV